jgi:hypothetical protein
MPVAGPPWPAPNTAASCSAAIRARPKPCCAARADTAEALGMSWLAERVRATLALAGGSTPGPAFRRDGEVWELSYDGMTIRLPDAKGLHDIATLLANAGTRIPAAQLVGNGAEAEAAYSADDVLDDSARAAYRQRLADLDNVHRRRRRDE